MRRRELTGLTLGVIACAIAPVLSMAQEAPPCPPRGFTPQLMTPAAGTLPRDGALLVGLFPGGTDASGTLPPLAMTRGRHSIALRTEPIAPGLFRLVPETTRLSGRYDVTGLSGAPQLYFGRAPLPAAPAVPGLERAERYLVAGAEGRRLEVRAHFAFPMPAEVVAVLSYFGEDDAPDAFTRSAPMQSSLVLFTTSERCDAHPPGTTPPPEVGGTVRVAFVDRHGQVSGISAPRPIE